MGLFDNLVYNENTFTELFKNVLAYKVFRKAVFEIINLDVVNDDFEYEDISTQTKVEYGIPDIVISNEEINVLIEIKVWNTQLTPNQPEGYLRSLASSKQKKKMLILIIPQSYTHLKEYKNRINAYPNSILNKIITWRQIIKQMDHYELHGGNPILQEYYMLLKEWFEPVPIKITSKFISEMFSKDTPNHLAMLTEIVDDVKYQLERRDVKITSRKLRILDEYGLYLKHDDFTVFIGEWFWYWQETGNPLCLSIYTADEIKEQQFIDFCKRKNYGKPQKLDNNPWQNAAIPFSTKEPFDKEAIAEDIKELITALNTSVF